MLHDCATSKFIGEHPQHLHGRHPTRDVNTSVTELRCLGGDFHRVDKKLLPTRLTCFLKNRWLEDVFPIEMVHFSGTC